MIGKEFHGIFKELRSLSTRQMDKRVRVFVSHRSRRASSNSGQLRFPQSPDSRTPFGSRHQLETGNLCLFINGDRKLLDVQFEVRISTAISLLECIQLFGDRKPIPVRQTDSSKHIVLRIDVANVCCTGGIKIKQILLNSRRTQKMEAREGSYPHCAEAHPGHLSRYQT